MEPVQAVDIRDTISIQAENGEQGQQAGGFGPYIICGEIMNPGIDGQDMGSIF